MKASKEPLPSKEQFANIEVLRLWEDDGVNTPGGSGGVMALLHMSSSFGQGWAKWWMNSSRQQVRVKDEQNKFAKLKGIDIRVLRPVEVRSSTANGVRSSSTFSDSAACGRWILKRRKGPREMSQALGLSSRRRKRGPGSLRL